ncbi:MAG: Inosose isomerase [uncultured Thermomicrobiales bacterium]|uniref:Inosose isomerase n=1 Tax=uncultured Thermomicrobiales bacterium TaxID=1645740 RepID=A0A6J4TWF9_9BACT|nr:MAG: Inosose isomerase [uncultured Thermomicrobiales bacterium]
MKVGVFMVLFAQRAFEEALDYVKETGCGAVEIGTGAYPGNAHCDPAALLEDAGARDRFKQAVESRGLEISALSCHGNPLHPNADQAQADDRAFRDTVRLAAEIGVGTVITFSGCPGDSDTAQKPNWVTCPWPPDFSEILEWQWAERVTPYWSEAAAFAKQHGVRVAIELHPGFVAYHTGSFLRLRKIGRDTLGVNFDPSHLFWQGMDPLVCARELGDAIFHVHMKDTWLDQANIRRNGVLDTKSYTDEKHRSWIFRTVGYGHGAEFWRALISELRLAGYDGSLSIEHEDSLLSINEGFTKAVDFLKQSVLTEQPGAVWWA